MLMYDKLRRKTGKYFINKYNGGGPAAPAVPSIGEIKQDESGQYSKWNGFAWEPIDSSLIATPTPELPAPVTSTAGWTKQAPDGTTYQFTGTSWENTEAPSDTPPGPTLLERAQAATDAWTRREDESAEDFRERRSEYSRKDLRGLKKELRKEKRGGNEEAGEALSELKAAQFTAGYGGTANGTVASAVGNFADGNWKTGVTDLAVAGMKAVDNAVLGDKNFGAQSAAIDTAVHGVSSALMKSGNPYAMAAGAALEGANFLTKAGGQTVQGFDVDIKSSGYGQMGHMESSSSRDFGAMIGLGGIFGQGRIRAKLAKRNAQAQMAINAANIAEDQSFEQEARANSIQNTIMNNNIALAGGLSTSLLGG